MRFILVVLSLIALPAMATDWKRDLTALTTQVSQVHPRFRECAVAADFTARADALAARAPSLSDAQVAVEIQRLLASIGDGHTLLWPFGMKAGILKKIPLTLWWFDDGLYVIDAEERSYVGRRVVRIGTMAAGDVLAALEPFVSHDNEMQFRWAAPFYATVSDFLVAAGAVPSPDEVSLTFEDGKSHVFSASPIDPEKIELKLVAQPQRAPAWLRRRSENFYVERIRPGVLYVAVNAMQDAPGQTLKQFGEQLRERLGGIDRVILDLRLNNGGDASKADELMKTLIAFDARGGRLLTLVSRMTFSAAQTFASRIDQWTATTFVGEPTGSRPNHYGNERTFKLPESGLRGTIASGLNQPVTPRDERTAITPEVRVEQKAADYFGGKDPALEAALDAIGQPGPSAPK